MTKLLSFIAAVVCAFAFTGTVIADDAAPAAAPAAPAAQMAPAKQTKTSIRTGEVVSVDVAANQLVVKSSEAKQESVTFNVTPKTNIKKAGKVIALSDIVSGDKVIVAYKHKDNNRIATAIKVKAPKAAPAATPAQ